jgi:hypothetical protein
MSNQITITNPYHISAKTEKFIKFLIVSADVVASVAASPQSNVQTFHSCSDAIPHLYLFVDHPREFDFDPNASRSYSDAHADYSNREVRMASFAIGRRGGL